MGFIQISVNTIETIEMLDVKSLKSKNNEYLK